MAYTNETRRITQQQQQFLLLLLLRSCSAISHSSIAWPHRKWNIARMAACRTEIFTKTSLFTFIVVVHTIHFFFHLFLLLLMVHVFLRRSQISTMDGIIEKHNKQTITVSSRAAEQPRTKSQSQNECRRQIFPRPFVTLRLSTELDKCILCCWTFQLSVVLLHCTAPLRVFGGRGVWLVHASG